MSEKMLVTQALDERDLLVKKIADKIAKASFVDTIKPNEDKVYARRMEKSEYAKEAEASYQQVVDLIDRYQRIDAAIVEEKALAVAKYCYDSARQCVEEARPTIEALYAKYPLVLVSNFYGNVESVLADFNLRHYFKEIVESAVVGVRKPDPRIFALGVEALNLKPEEVIVIGDSYKKDIVPAETIGCKVAWIKGKGWTADEDAVTHPCIISQLSDVLKQIES